ncbi:MAG: ABC transporter ATP-binding protein [Bacilli bacterium]|nr:ABC transporter ATP-binding protein [Bacilli bacterium]
MKITLKNVGKKFKNNIILSDVNMEFEESKIYGIVGPNGSGKSVLLKMICGFYETSFGQILFDNVDEIKKYGFPKNMRVMIENPMFLSDISGFDNLKLLADIQGKIDENRIIDTMKMVGLDPYDDKKFSSYSLGMKQKLNIAQVLMEDPKIIILDEPFNALDEKSSKEIRRIFIDEKKKGKIIILATHIKEDINSLCDEIYLVENCTIKKK